MEKTTERITYINGRWVPESKATIHIYDEQFMYGSAVFEMHRTFNHEHFLLDEHIDRLFNSMRSFYIPIDKTREEIKSIFNELMVRNADHYVNDEYRFMVNVSRGPMSIYKDVFTLEFGDEWNKPTWILNDWPLSKTAKHLAHFYDSGVNAVLVNQRQIPSQFLDAKVKSRSRAHYKIADIEATKFGRDAMALLQDDQGLIVEGTGSNFAIVKNGCIIVPELRNLLRGCSIMYVINVIAPQLNLRVIEKNITPYDVLDADEAFFTGTFVNLLPCNRLNGQYLKSYNGDCMGHMTKMIANAWSQNVGLDIIQQVKTWGNNV